jgi:hypothetical protein
MKFASPTLDDLLKHIEQDEIVKAAITESIHRFYYDKCFSLYTERPFDTPDVKAISKLHNIFSCLHAGWRHKIKKRFERYDGREDTIALNIN